jgi:hypothetical protein
MTQASFGGISPAALGIPHTVQVHPQSGALSVSVAVEVTPGRNGFVPRLALDYQSGALNGAYGRGWSLSGLLSIGINTARGLPRYDTSDAYVRAGAGELTIFGERADDSSRVFDPIDARGLTAIRRVHDMLGRGHQAEFKRKENSHEDSKEQLHWAERSQPVTLADL